MAAKRVAAMADTWTLPQIAEAVGAEYRTLKTWEALGVIVPSLRKGSGAGTPDLYSAADVHAIATLARLRRDGLTLDALKLLAADVRKGSATCPICGTKIAI